MVSEEIGLNAALEAAGIEAVETDLGEYIIQIRHEAPSHIIAPAVHLNRDQIEQNFRTLHKGLPAERDLAQASDLSAKLALCFGKFLAADVGITGANFLIAETGSSVIVTNEGNGDLTQLLPRVHIVIASIEIDPHARRRVHDFAPARPLRDRPGNHQLHNLLHRPAPRCRPGWPQAYHVVLSG